MAYVPISNTVPQYAASGSALASTYYLKGYVSGTSTPLSMGIDKTPTSTLAKCALNSLGYPISNSSDETTIFIPHFNAEYKLVLYPSEATADANDFASAVWVVDSIGEASVSNIKYFDTVAALVAADVSVGDSVETLGYYAANDKGGAKYRIVAGGTGTDDGGSYLDLSNGNQAELITGGAISVRVFGATGDGVTDDTNFINNLVAYLSSQGGGILLLPQGTYLTTGIDVKSKISYRGEGSDCTFIKVSGANNYGFRTEAQSTMLASGNASYGTFEDFQIQFTLGSQAGISYVGVSYWFARNITNLMGTVGATGIECIPTKTTSTGGPSQWYNTFVNIINVGTASAKAAGSVGWDIGGVLATDEAANAWNIFGGRTNAQDVAVWIKAANSITIQGHTTEGNNQTYLMGTTGVGERLTRNCKIRDAYIEGGVDGFTLNANTLRCEISPSYITSITGTAYTDNGTSNDLVRYDSQTVLSVDQWELVTNSTSPKISGTNPELLIDDGSGDLYLQNRTGTSAANQIFRVYDGTNSIFQAGNSNAQFRAAELVIGAGSTAITIYSGTLNPPGGGIGNDGDIYISTSGGGKLFQKRSGTWTSI